MIFRNLFAAALAAILLTSVPASAATYTVAYNDPVTPLGATLLLTTEDVLNSYGGYTVTGISGSVGGDPLTSLILADGSAPCPCFPEGFGALGGTLSLTNTLYRATTYLSDGQLFDHGGLGFQSATTYYNMYGIGGDAYELDSWSIDSTIDPETGYPIGFAFSIGTASVPEPATWGLMILGFGAIGGALRRRQTDLAAV